MGQLLATGDEEGVHRTCPHDITSNTVCSNGRSMFNEHLTLLTTRSQFLLRGGKNSSVQSIAATLADRDLLQIAKQAHEYCDRGLKMYRHVSC
jgi:hypothetical protein